MVNVPAVQRKTRRIAKRYGLNPNIFERQIGAETGWAPDVLTGKRHSPKGAAGAGQFIPGTAKAYGVDVNNITSSLDGAARYLRDNLRKYGSYRAALSVYNSGDPNGYKTIAETRAYVRKILGGSNPRYSDTGGQSGSSGSTTIPGGTVPASSTATTLPGAADFALPDLKNSTLPTPAINPPAFAAGFNLDPRPAPIKNLDLGNVQNQTLGAIRDQLNGIPQSTATLPGVETPSVTVPGITVPGGSTRRTSTKVTGHGGWEGTQGIAEDLGHVSGLAFGSQKRAKRLTVDGLVSDHYQGEKDAYAIDLDSRNHSTKALEAGARRIARALGIKNYTPNRIYNVNKGGYRIQLIYGAAVGHADHVHIGVKKIGK